MLAGLILLFGGCSPINSCFEPNICYTPSSWHANMLPSPFEPLTDKELACAWGAELHIAQKFAREGDYYRAITSYKRALFLCGKSNPRRREMEWGIVLSYYMGQKYSDVILSFEGSSLPSVSSDFPAFRDLILVLQESYQMIGSCEKGELLFDLLEKGDPESAEKVLLSNALLSGRLSFAQELAPEDKEIADFSRRFCKCYKSPQKAKALNAILPGAGYYYVGQKKSALTSLIINTAFTAAAYHFFEQGNWGAGIITASLEMGWYFGGINGAGLAAKEYNEWTYSRCVKDIMENKRLFPVLMLETSF